jgi:SAM-dependent methyltransferase
MHANQRLVLHYGLTIFLSAFLLFQVQPIIGKMILPWFGGSASVWTTCMLFFQVLLLLGYFYSHWIVRFLSPRSQSLLHVSLLAVCLLLLPVSPSPDWRPTGAENPTLRILMLLAATIGLPYFVLSTTGPLIQAWFARERPGSVPYRLFALSNLGSLLALLAYPVLVEPVLATRWQSIIWSSLFVAFALLCALLAWRGSRAPDLRPAMHHEAAPAPGGRDLLTWGALAACPSILMIADTSYLTENIAPMPLLWVVPLALYLLSFVLCFEGRNWYKRAVFLPLLVLGLGFLAWLPTQPIDALPLPWAISFNQAAFFVACMVCHGELSTRRPHPAHLTGFYLMLATGGAAGGLFCGIVAPYFFNSHYELSVGIVLTAVVVALALLPGYRFANRRLHALAWLAAAGFTGVILYIRVEDHLDELDGAKVTMRNFYGVLRVYERGEGEEAYRTLLHGQIAHGRQYAAADRQDRPTSYYSPESGVGRALLAKGGQHPLRVGVVGLGVGTLTSYGRPGDYYRLYEIDPLVIALARSRFTFLSRTRATTDMVLGDARLALDRESPQAFDVLVVDAFSGDAVPIHLLTREAFESYFRHLKPDGVLAVHITNRFLDLRPVVRSAADSLGAQARLVYFDGDSERLLFHSSWVLVSRDGAVFAHPQLRQVAEEIAARPAFRLWRDDYSSVFAVLK